MTINYEQAEQWARTILHGNHIKGRKNAARALFALMEENARLNERGWEIDSKLRQAEAEVARLKEELRVERAYNPGPKGGS